MRFVVSVIFDYTVMEDCRMGVLIWLRVQFPAFVKLFTNADVLDLSVFPRSGVTAYSGPRVPFDMFLHLKLRKKAYTMY
jgi:hypothetical protein